MKPEGMVHALEEIHRLLKADGILIDIHPFAEDFMVEVYQDGRLIFSEPRTGGSTEGYRLSDEALEQVVQRNHFVLERNEQFDYHVYASSIDELFDYYAQIDAYEESIQEELQEARQAEIYVRVEGILQEAGFGAEVASHERVHIACLKPIK